MQKKKQRQDLTFISMPSKGNGNQFLYSSWSMIQIYITAIQDLVYLHTDIEKI